MPKFLKCCDWHISGYRKPYPFSSWELGIPCCIYHRLVYSSCDLAVYVWGFLSYDTVVLQMNREKLMKMASAVRTGGKGSVRRSVHPVRIGYIFCYKTLL